MAKRGAPEVNAGSMADIAFLLLIFFLVTTTIESGTGISTKLPPKPKEQEAPPPIKEKNIFTVLVNKNDQLLVEDELMELKDLRSAAIDFLDNGGGSGKNECSYCQGAKDPASSDNPQKAVISLRNDRQTSYKMYVAVRNELVAAYSVLRDRESARLYPKEVPYTEMDAQYNDARTSDDRKKKLKKKIQEIQDLFPQKLSEAEPKKNI